MSNINARSIDIFAIPGVQDIPHESAATYTGGIGRLNGNDPDVILHKDLDGKGLTLNVNAATNDGIPNIGFSDGKGGGFETTFNDTVSSITIKRGAWQFFADTNFKGDTTGRLEAGKLYNLGANNDKISSLVRVG